MSSIHHMYDFELNDIVTCVRDLVYVDDKIAPWAFTQEHHYYLNDKILVIVKLFPKYFVIYRKANKEDSENVSQSE